MISILLAIIAAELGIIVIGLGFRLVTEAMLIHQTMQMKKAAAGGLPPGFRELSSEEMKAMGIDVSKLNVEPEKPVHGQYV